MYSIRGVLASGSKHYHHVKTEYDDRVSAKALTRGRSSVKGENLVSKASANTTACRGSSLSSSPALPFCAPFFALGAMAHEERSGLALYSRVGLKTMRRWVCVRVNLELWLKF